MNRQHPMKRRKILFLQKRLLFPTDSGGKIRTLNILRHLARWHDVTYLCNLLPSEESHLHEMQSLGLTMVTIPWTEAPRGSLRFYGDLALNLCSSFPFNVNKDFDPRLRQKAKQLLKSEKFDLLICDFVQMARNCLGFGQTPKLLFEHNVESQIFQRHADSDCGMLRRFYMQLQANKMKRFEKLAGDDFDRVVAVSEQDRISFQNKYDWHHVDVIETAVDTDYFQPQPTPETPCSCVFVGSMDWLPNEDGVLHFVENIWPLIRARYADASFQIVGRNPPNSILALDKKNGIHVTGSVPDVRPFMAQAQVVVIPLLVGGGTRLKVFEAMAMGKPIVSTSLGVEGLLVVDDENALLADTPVEFVEKVSRMFESVDLRRRLTDRAFDMVLERYSTEPIARQFEAICLATIESRK